eukprot:8474644-Heterocapsa_arctica.AAC.1
MADSVPRSWHIPWFVRRSRPASPSQLTVWAPQGSPSSSVSLSDSGDRRARSVGPLDRAHRLQQPLIPHSDATNPQG